MRDDEDQAAKATCVDDFLLDDRRTADLLVIDEYQEFLNRESTRRSLDGVRRAVAETPAALAKTFALNRRPRFFGGFYRVELQKLRSSKKTRPGDDAARTAFEWAALLTPRRIRVEEVGDAQEELNRLLATGASRVRITAYVVAQLFYIGVNTLGYLVKKLSPFFGGQQHEK